MIHRNIVHLFHGDAVDLVCHGEKAVDHVFHFEPGTQFFGIVGKEFFFEFIAVISPIPTHQGVDAIQLFCQFGHFFAFLQSGWICHFIHFVQKASGCVYACRHTVFQHIFGMVFVAQELGAFFAQDQCAFDKFLIVKFIFEGTGTVGGRDFAADLAVFAIGEQRVYAGGLQREEPAAFFALSASGKFRSIHYTLRQTIQFGGIGDVQLKTVGSV